MANQQKSSKVRRMLSDHRQVGKRFIPPMVDVTGSVEGLNWPTVLSPSAIWPALAQWQRDAAGLKPAEHRLDGARFPVTMIDGVEYAGETMIVALRITEDGSKRILGLRQGATENAAVCVALLEHLQERGLDTSQPALFVLDGTKALYAAVKRRPACGKSWRKR